MGGSGPSRLPCQGCAGNAGGGMVGLTVVGAVGCWPLLLLLPFGAATLGCPPGMYQGVLLFQPAGNATDASGLLCTVCITGKQRHVNENFSLMCCYVTTL